jgi:hypothetical protein
MSPTGCGKSRNEQFLDTLADELDDTPVSELADDDTAGDSPSRAIHPRLVRLLIRSRENARRRRMASSVKKKALAAGTPCPEEASSLEAKGVDE